MACTEYAKASVKPKTNWTLPDTLIVATLNIVGMKACKNWGLHDWSEIKTTIIKKQPLKATRSQIESENNILLIACQRRSNKRQAVTRRSPSVPPGISRGAVVTTETTGSSSRCKCCWSKMKLPRQTCMVVIICTDIEWLAIKWGVSSFYRGKVRATQISAEVDKKYQHRSELISLQKHAGQTWSTLSELAQKCVPRPATQLSTEEPAFRSKVARCLRRRPDERWTGTR